MRIVLTKKARDLMRLYVESVDTEISGMGKATFDSKKKEWIIDDIKIFEQEVTGITTDLEGEDIAKFATTLVEEGESLENWCLWWHSHVNMAVNWSGTDTGTMAENPFAANHMLSIVTNKKEEYRARLDMYNPCHVHLDNIDVATVLPSFPKRLVDFVKKDIKEKVKPKTFKPNDKDIKNYSRQNSFGTKDNAYSLHGLDLNLENSAQSIVTNTADAHAIEDIIDNLYNTGGEYEIALANRIYEIITELKYPATKAPATNAVEPIFSKKQIKKEALKQLRNYAANCFLLDEIEESIKATLNAPTTKFEGLVAQRALNYITKGKLPKDVLKILTNTEQNYK